MSLTSAYDSVCHGAPASFPLFVLLRWTTANPLSQTPTLNARPIVRAVKQACRRGVSVSLLLDLGFNDKGESIPFQGGTNEEVVVRLYKALRAEKKEQYLKVYWYTGKDQVRPLNAVKKQRNCHIKFAAYDDEVLIIGNGNQDSQSWFHSQEVNIMVDSKVSFGFYLWDQVERGDDDG